MVLLQESVPYYNLSKGTSSRYNPSHNTEFHHYNYFGKEHPPNPIPDIRIQDRHLMDYQATKHPIEEENLLNMDSIHFFIFLQDPDHPIVHPTLNILENMLKSYKDKNRRSYLFQ